MRKIILATLALSLAISFQGCDKKKDSDIDVTTKMEQLSVRLPIPVVEAGQTPFYVAVDKGYYKEEGLEVAFNLASKELNPIKMVESGKDAFGVIGGPDTLIVARSKGFNLKAISVLHKDSNFPCLITLKSSGITELKQLENKKIGFFYGHISTDVLRYLLSKNNIKYQEVDVGFNYSQLVAKQLDAEWAFTVTAGLELPAKGEKINIISPKDYGITTHGYTIFAKDSYLKENKEIAKKFIRATMKGIKYTLENPDDALKSLLSRNKKLKLELSLKRLKMYNAVTSNKPVGYMDTKMFQETYDRLNSQNILKSQYDIKDIYTLDFLN
jgi:NitT/TauT family transport system substrate-binding protein